MSVAISMGFNVVAPDNQFEIKITGDTAWTAIQIAEGSYKSVLDLWKSVEDAVSAHAISIKTKTAQNKAGLVVGMFSDSVFQVRFSSQESGQYLGFSLGEYGPGVELWGDNAPAKTLVLPGVRNSEEPMLKQTQSVQYALDGLFDLHRSLARYETRIDFHALCLDEWTRFGELWVETGNTGNPFVYEPEFSVGLIQPESGKRMLLHPIRSGKNQIKGTPTWAKTNKNRYDVSCRFEVM